MEHHGAKIAICFTIAVWSIFLLKDSQSHEGAGAAKKWSVPPSMEAFENYEEMERYIGKKNSKTLSNPQEDSYIDAYNFHHESALNFRRRRGTEAIGGPKIFKFAVEDAREPDEATKELIRKHRGRELRLQEEAKKNAPNSKSRKKRSPQKTEPKFIRFEVSDAREPDEATKELIRHGRAREMRLTTERTLSTTSRPVAELRRKVTRKRKRTRRSAQVTQPQYIRFEIEDAKEPDLNMREMLREHGMRSMNAQSPLNESQILADDSDVEESKRIFFYHAAPVKTKRVVNAVPTEVKKIIELMLKDHKGQAYYKYVPAGQDAKLRALEKLRPIYGAVPKPVHPPHSENLVTVYPDQAYVQKLVPVPVAVPVSMPVQTFPVKILSPAPTAPAPAPVSEQQQYYHAAPSPQSGPGDYQQPTTYLKVIPAMTQVFHKIPSAPALQQPQQQHYPAPEPSHNSIISNEIPKPYPYAKIHPVEPLYRYGKRLNFYPTAGNQQTIVPNDHSVVLGGPTAPGEGHVAGLSIENQQQLVKEQQQEQQYPHHHQHLQQRQIPLKDMQEFEELSALIGKSPTDQIHGLAYLLAKEMQRTKRLKAQRPQDNTSPILFHPEPHVGVAAAVDAPQQPDESKIPSNQGNVLSQPQPSLPPPPPPPPTEVYAPAVEPVAVAHVRPIEVVPPPPPPPPATSYNVVKTLGLSPNYKGIDQFDEAPPLHEDVEDGLGLQYASKYAFGYRVRDFYTGNDFGHKQNRDLDGVTRGQYHILLPDGRVQNVIYHADDTGFHADVSFETGHH